MLDELDLDEDTKSTLLNNIARRLTPQAVKVRADVEVSCYAYDGIDAVKNSLLEGLKCSSEEIPIKVCSQTEMYPGVQIMGSSGPLLENFGGPLQSFWGPANL